MSEDNDCTVWDALCDPFPVELIELKPGATTSDKKKALGLAYVDKRMYDERLDSVVGPENWHDLYEPWGENRVICHLTINGITKCDAGEASPNDPNAATIAVAQAFKRACSRFGLGRYLYSLEGIWLDYDVQKKRFSGDTTQAVRQMYQKARLFPKPAPSRNPTLDTQAASGSVDRKTLTAEIINFYAGQNYDGDKLDKMATKLRAKSDAELIEIAADTRAKQTEARATA